MTKSLYLNIAKLTRLNILMRKRMTLRLTALTTSSTPGKPKAIVIKLVKVVTLLNRDPRPTAPNSKSRNKINNDDEAKPKLHRAKHSTTLTALALKLKAEGQENKS